MILRKQHTLLLEVLIAFTIVLFCLFPLLSPHIYIVKEERKFMEELELDRFADLYFAYFLQQLYENRITWDELITHDDVRSLQPEETKNSRIAGDYYIKNHQGKGPTGDTSHLFDVRLTLRLYQDANARQENIKPLSTYEYPYEVFVKRKIPLGKDKPNDKEKSVEANSEELYRSNTFLEQPLEE